LKDRYAMAAEASGERARGEVTRAIRARAVCRNATNAASRRLLHLHGERTYPPTQSQRSEMAREEEACTKERVKGVGPNFNRSASPVMSLNSTVDDEVRRRSSARVIKVTRGCLLGKMATEDPERAKRFNLVVVPSWTQNKPWPPPPVKFRKVRPKALKKTEEIEETSTEKLSFRQQLQVNREKSVPLDDGTMARPDPTAKYRQATVQLSAVTKFLGLRKPTEDSKNAVRHKGSIALASKGSVTDKNGNQLADLDLAVTLLDYKQKEELKDIFSRFQVPGNGKLTRAGMVKALQAAGHAPTTNDEQQVFAAVQEQIIAHTRPNNENGESNPVTVATGLWEFYEFLLMVEALREISERQVRSDNKDMAQEFKISTREVEELRAIFKKFDVDDSGSISSSELKSLLAALEMQIDDEDFKLLFKAVGLQGAEQLEIKQFVMIALQINELAQYQSDTGSREAGRCDSPGRTPAPRKTVAMFGLGAAMPQA